MSIITWNVNGIRACYKKGFRQWLEQESPDILCIQESKAHESQLEEEIISIAPYKSYWCSATKKGYSGTACYTKKEPLKIEALGVEEFDDEGRVQVIFFDEFVLINAYFPNSQEKGRRVDYKIRFCETLLKRAQELEASGKGVVILGDYNIAHTEIDLKNPDSNHDSPGFLPQERQWMTHFLSSGYVDTFRHFTKDPEHYTWWSYRTRARERNAGWRIDTACVNEAFLPKVKACTILNEVMGSDHCPVKLELAL